MATIVHLSKETVSRDDLSAAMGEFVAELKGVYKTKRAQKEITIEPGPEADFWLNPDAPEIQHPRQGRLAGFAALDSQQRLVGIICASTCIRTENHTRHFGAARQAVEFVSVSSRGRKRKKSDEAAAAAVSADVLVWHLFVRPSGRRQGVASRLLDTMRNHAARLASAAGSNETWVRVSGEVLRLNAPALGFWRSYLFGLSHEPGARGEESGMNEISILLSEEFGPGTTTTASLPLPPLLDEIKPSARDDRAAEYPSRSRRSQNGK